MFDFPNSPAIGNTFTPPGGPTYKWDGQGWISLAATGGGSSGGTVTSVEASGGTTGLTFSGGPITSDGTLTLGGTLKTTNGGTGLTTVGTNGQYLTSNGTAAAWTTGPTLPGANTWTAANTFSSTLTATGGVNVRSLCIFNGWSIFAQQPFFTFKTEADVTIGSMAFDALGDVWSISSTGSALIQTNLTNGDFIVTTGNAYKTGGGSWAATSDITVKKNVADYTKGLAELSTLRTVTYQYNGLYGSPDDGVTHGGLVAQEVQTSAFPELIRNYTYRETGPSGIKTDPASVSKDLLAVDPSDLIFAVINALMEIKVRLEALEGVTTTTSTQK